MRPSHVVFAADMGLSDVKFDQQLLTRCVTAGMDTLQCTNLHFRAGLNWDFILLSRSRVQPDVRGWLSPLTTCCLHELTWSLPPADDEEEAAWLKGSQKLKRDSRRKERLCETADIDKAFIQQHLLHHCCLLLARFDGQENKPVLYGLFSELVQKTTALSEFVHTTDNSIIASSCFWNKWWLLMIHMLNRELKIRPASKN